MWNAWGHALIRMEHYAQARVKFKYVKFIFHFSDLIFLVSFFTSNKVLFLFFFPINGIKSKFTSMILASWES